MSEEIGFRDRSGQNHEPTLGRRLVPMRVGNAIVYVEQVGKPAEVEGSDQIYTAAPSTDVAFEEATKVLKECVGVVGGLVSDLGEGAKPRQMRVEFTLSLEAKGEAKIIPMLLTGEVRATSGFKVTAVWGDLEGS